MCALALCSVDDLEQHGIGDVELRELVEGRSRQEELATVIGLLTLRSRHHSDRIAAVVFVEAASPATGGSLLHSPLVHAGVVLVEVVSLVLILVW